MMTMIEISTIMIDLIISCFLCFSSSKLNQNSLPISCKLVNQTVLQTSLENVLSLRLREGYTVKRVQIQKGFLFIFIFFEINFSYYR
jgi:hypothetical protein